MSYHFPRIASAIPLLLGITGCTHHTQTPSLSGHLHQEAVVSINPEEIPPLVSRTRALPLPPIRPQTEIYSVVVNNVKAQDLLFALARDAKLNIDIHPGITGTVTLNAIDQTLQQLLTRIARQVDMRWELAGADLTILPDTPFLRTYAVDYVNMSRDTAGTMTVATQIASTVGSASSNNTAPGSSNNSQTKIENKSQNRFWATLERNIKDILRETDKILPDGSSETVIEKDEQQNATGLQTKIDKAGTMTQTGTGAGTSNIQQEGTTVVRRNTVREAASVIINPEAGVVSVRATERQHEKIREFIDSVMVSVRRQVLIEATIAEVQLSSSYQQGINWAALATGRAGFQLRQAASGGISAPPSSLFELSYLNSDSRLGNISGTVKLLESFGDVRVLSSPKISVLNNQTAVLKVVDNSIYFTIKADTTTNQTTSTTTFTTDLHSVPVGFVMNVTPQIGDQDSVLLNIRPSISRIVGTVPDPNPALKTAGITSAIPIIRTREMESVIRVDNGNIAVMGGLMEDMQDNQDNGVPGLAQLPGVGTLFQHRNDNRSKTELVVFLRPAIIKEAGIQGDYGVLRDKLPSRHFFSPEKSLAR